MPLLGYRDVGRGGFIPKDEDLKKGAPDVTKEGPGEDVFHLSNFQDCIMSRKKPNADVEIGHRSSTVCHLLNICRELGRKLRWDPHAERFTGDDEANQMLSRPRRHGFELPNVTGRT